MTKATLTLEEERLHRPRDGSSRARVHRMVAAASDANRPFLADGVRFRMNKGLRITSIERWVLPMTRLDAILAGKPFATATPDDLAFAVSKLHEMGTMAQNTIANHAEHIKGAWRDILDTDHLPRNIKRSLDVRREKLDEPAGRLISTQEFHSLLAAASDLKGGKGGLPARVLAVAILWTLWDGGHRAEEMLSLNVGDVILYPNGLAKLRLRPEAPALGQGEHKTGPRTISVGECVPALKALLAMHPRGTESDAPLFPNMHIRGRGAREDRMRYQMLNKFLAKIANASGVNADRRETFNVTAHDFRHTLATRRAKHWSDSLLRIHFGWGPSSRMPAYYAHIAESDLMDRVEADLGITPLGFTAASPQANDAQLLMNALVGLLAKEKFPLGRTPAPMIGR